MKIGILGGTLNPVHNGHIAVALAAKAQLGLDAVLLMPSGNPPHKCLSVEKRHRLRMAEIAAQSHEGIFASDVEIEREGTTYTVDTLSQLTVEHPGAEWYFLVGADALNTMEKWREFPRIARLCTFAAVNRPGCDESLMRLRANALRQSYGARVEILTVTGPQISSTHIRARVAENRSIEGMTPPAVAAYIAQNGLYLCDYSEDEVIARLKRALTFHRFTHTLGVANTAQRLAERNGVDPQRARLAGLLHDCAKSMPLNEMRALVMAHLPDLDSEELDTRAILHAPAGMVLAERDYGVRDPQILSAIRKHTVGDAEMSPMDALIYVADFIEPGRESFPGLDDVRRMAEKDLRKAMRMCAELTAEHLRSRGQPIHPRTMKLLNALNSNQGGAES